MMNQNNTPEQNLKMAQVIFVNHSGGKDSQAMLAWLIGLGLIDKIVIIHADLGDMEWEPMEAHINNNPWGLKAHVVHPERSFWQLCRDYGRIPDGRARFCTSKLKTDPCAKFIRKYMADNNIQFAINAMGMRKQESKKRAAYVEWNESELTAPTLNRFVLEWYPILDQTEDWVRSTVASSGQQLHKVYSMGFSRLSCVMCVLGRVSEHKLVKELRPDVFNKMAALERELGKTIRVSKRKKNGITTVSNVYLDGGVK